MLYRNSVFNAKSVDPDQTPRSAASDQDLHSLPMSLFWEAMLKWVKQITKKDHNQTTRMHRLILAVCICD